MARASESATDRITEIAGQGLTALKAQTEARAAATKAAADEAAAKAEAEIGKAKEAADKATAAVKDATESATAAAQSKAAATIAKVSAGDANVKQWAKWMAEQLRQLPDIQAYGNSDGCATWRSVALRRLGRCGARRGMPWPSSTATSRSKTC